MFDSKNPDEPNAGPGWVMPELPNDVREVLAREEKMPDRSADVAAVLAAIDTALASDLTENPVAALLAGDVEVLAKVKHQIDAELARRITAAERLDGLMTGSRVLLRQREWEPTPANRQVTAAHLTAKHSALHGLWADGRVSVDKIHALAIGIRRLPIGYRADVVDAITPLLPALRVRELIDVLQRWADALQPPTDASNDPDSAADAERVREQADYEARFLSLSESQGLVHLTGLLPRLEGETLKAVLNAYAHAARTQGDGKTRGQRLADALMALVGAAQAKDLVPRSQGASTAATIVIPLTEADRIARQAKKPRLPVPAAGDVTLEALVEVINTHRATQATIGDRLTLGDAAAAFTLCTGTLTGAITRPVSGASAPGGSNDSDGSRSGGPGHRRPLAAALTDALADSQVQPLAMGRAVRLATTAQRKALLLRDRTCSIPGCEVPGAECDTHHINEWANGGGTDIDTMMLLCWPHHRELDLNRWKITRNHPTPTGLPWRIEPTPRHQWRPRR